MSNACVDVFQMIKHCAKYVTLPYAIAVTVSPDQHYDVTAEQRQFEHITQIIDNLRVIGFLTAHVISALPCGMMERSGRL